ncbi:MAG: hypothetical protein GY782_08485 [Gammaproteobacteria bacterium]|nr:hypothetical protein [Gammaproteobacteria bacterium]
MDREIVYLNKDNSIDVILKENSTAISTTAITQMKLTVGAIVVESTNNSTHAILWDKTTYATGEVHLILGTTLSTAELGNYDAPLTVYDSAHTNGLVWGEVPLLVIKDVETT